jgi:hypothetical protein
MLKITLVADLCVQVTPSGLDAIALVPWPTATTRVGPAATPNPDEEKMLVPVYPVQVVASAVPVAIQFVPFPTATHIPA